MISCGHFDRNFSDQSLSERRHVVGEDISWDRWRPKAQRQRTEILVVPAVRAKFKYQGEFLNPTEDPLMLYRGNYIFK